MKSRFWKCTPPAPAVKFSNETERFQIINSIRRAPVRAQIKRVIDLLLERRATFTPELINEACYVDVNANRVVIESLKNNAKVNYDGRVFFFFTRQNMKLKIKSSCLYTEVPRGHASD